MNKIIIDIQNRRLLFPDRIPSGVDIEVSDLDDGWELWDIYMEFSGQLPEEA